MSAERLDMPGYRLLTENATKTEKGEKFGYLTGILYLMPDDYLCPSSTPACRAACLVGSGRARIFPAVEAARRERTRLFYQDRELFRANLKLDVWLLTRRAAKKGLKPALRLNGTSDVSPHVFKSVYELATDLGVVTYEYTKRIELIEQHAELVADDERGALNGLPMHYTFSASDNNAREQAKATALGYPIAVVYDRPKSAKLPPVDYVGGIPLKVVDGDKSDLRFADAELMQAPMDRSYIVGLRLKRTSGDAVARQAGFAV